MDYEDRLRVATPEGVALHLVLAGPGSRGVAALLDGLVQLGVLLAVAVVAIAIARAGVAWAGVMVASLGTFAVLFLYHVLFETLRDGESPGKRKIGLRVVTADGRPIGFLGAVIRNVLRLVDFLPSAYIVGLVCMIATQANQRVGDLVAGTVVVRTRTETLPLGDVPLLTWGTHSWDLTAVTDDEVNTVRKFLARREDLPPDARHRLAHELAGRLGPKVAGAASARPAEEFLEAIVARKSRRDR